MKPLPVGEPSEPRGTPKISVIIPTRNRADTLAQAIDSVLTQTLSDFELIVIDDASTDHTRTTVMAYGQRVRYAFEPAHRGGAARGRNTGMRMARGQYLAFLDDDDLYYPYMLELQSRLLDRRPDVGMVYAEMSAFDDEGFFERYHLKTYHESAFRAREATYERIFESSARLGDLDILPASLAAGEPALLDRRAYFGRIFDWYLTHVGVFQNNMMMRREAALMAGFRDERLKFWEDYDYNLRASRDNRVAFIDVPTYKLRYHGAQFSSVAGPAGRRIWLRKQQELLSVVKRRAREDQAYYDEHRDAIDRHLAHLHRAVAVPLMMTAGRSPRAGDYARRARTYLARCWRHGHPARVLWLLTYAPGPIRRFGVSVLGSARMLKARLRRMAAA